MSHPLQTKSLVFDVYAPIVRYDGGWIAIADLVTVLAQVGMEEQAVRSSVSRLQRRDMLQREVRDGTPGYALTTRSQAVLTEGDLRIYGSLEPAALDDGWALVTFSVPEQSRADRHQLRRRLSWLGYGNLGAGLWIAPRRILERTVAMVADLGLQQHVDIFTAHHAAFDDTEHLVSRCWDIDRMRTQYAAYLDTFTPIVQRWRKTDPAEDPRGAFADFIAAAHEWRKMPYLDPGLPAELLPEGWEGSMAADTFNQINTLLLATAQAYVAGVRRH
ncbi:MAG: PaaX family transcriptional regulator [Euzebya sp.]